ncbi:NAD-dependent epimerase/dehydratase family protein, partial [Streptomyces sp. SBT349]|uniref:NAD-dependent epimerase/dehydratase family protein n=1 Tax=Streptomyces sp. SBT349 TaxID=1580539 RepID=UPI000ABD7EEC
MTWLITGGAGYIGAHVVEAMRAAGEPVVVLDDLSTGAPDRLPADVPLVRGSVLDRALLDGALARHGVTGVVHLAAKKRVGESVAEPLSYYRENVHGLTVLLEAVAAAGLRRFVFSSSAAVYGTPDLTDADGGDGSDGRLGRRPADRLGAGDQRRPARGPPHPRGGSRGGPGRGR